MSLRRKQLGAIVLLCAGCGRSTLYALDRERSEGGDEPVVDAAIEPADATVLPPEDAATDAPAPIDAATPDAALPCPGGGTSFAYLWGATGELYAFDPPTLTTRDLGKVVCPTTAQSWTLSVTRTGIGYMLYGDWNVYRLDLTTMSCTQTAFLPDEVGLNARGQLAIAVSRDQAAERLYVYGMSWASTPGLAVADLTTFLQTSVGTVTPDPGVYPVDMQADAYGRLFALTSSGLLVELDSATARVLGQDQTTYRSGGSWAVMTWNDQLYFFADSQVSRYDLASKQLSVVGNVGDSIVGASAAACIH